MAPRLAVIVPVYNEADCLPDFCARLTAVLATLPFSTDILYVNDGSTDTSLQLIESMAAAHPGIGCVNLARNFGKEIAITAGLDHAVADAVIIIDADLQDPPELIPELVAAWQRGFDVVYATRRRRHGETWYKRASASLFYRLMQRVGGVDLPRDTGDFRLVSRRVVEALRLLRERHRFMKGLFAWVGFPSVAVFYDRAPRASGRSKWSGWKLWNLAIEGITGFTTMPLKIATYLGLLVAIGGGIFGLQLIFRTMVYGNPVPGYSSLMVVVLFMGGAQLVTLGVIGEYLGRIFNEAKQRPLYLVERATPPRTDKP